MAPEPTGKAPAATATGKAAIGKAAGAVVAGAEVAAAASLVSPKGGSRTPRTGNKKGGGKGGKWVGGGGPRDSVARSGFDGTEDFRPLGEQDRKLWDLAKTMQEIIAQDVALANHEMLEEFIEAQLDASRKAAEKDPSWATAAQKDKTYNGPKAMRPIKPLVDLFGHKCQLNLCVTGQPVEHDAVPTGGGGGGEEEEKVVVKRAKGSKGTWTPAAEVAWLKRIWPRAAPELMKLLATVREAAKDDEELRTNLAELYEVQREASEEMYKKQLDMARSDPVYKQFAKESKLVGDSLSGWSDLHDRFPETRLTFDETHALVHNGHRHTKSPRQLFHTFPVLLEDAATLKPHFDAFCKSLAAAVKARYEPAPLKNGYRILEKAAFRESLLYFKPEESSPLSKGFKETGFPGEFDVAKACDVLRGSIVCKDFSMLNTVVGLLHDLDLELFMYRTKKKEEDQPKAVRGITERIEVIRIKDRFAQPTSGCWADCLVNFRFAPLHKQAPGSLLAYHKPLTTHVCELQVQLDEMLTARKQGGGHASYGTYRGAFETLEAVVSPLADILPNEKSHLERLAADDSELAQEEMLNKIRALHEVLPNFITKLDELNTPRSAPADRRPAKKGFVARVLGL